MDYVISAMIILLDPCLLILIFVDSMKLLQYRPLNESRAFYVKNLQSLCTVLEST